jgi:hypothetical protein
MPRWLLVHMREAAARIAAPILVALLLGPVCNLPARAQTASPPATSVPPTSSPATGAQPSAGARTKSAKTKGSAATNAAGPPSRSLPNRFAGRAGVYYKVVWGIDSLSVKWTESGEMIRFSWRVVDPQLAALLNDKKIEPALIDPQAGVSLVVPVMEKIGQLRQTQRPEAGRSYWVAFSNKGGYVKRGHRVNVAIGTFRADGLVVD